MPADEPAVGGVPLAALNERVDEKEPENAIASQHHHTTDPRDVHLSLLPGGPFDSLTQKTPTAQGANRAFGPFLAYPF